MELDAESAVVSSPAETAPGIPAADFTGTEDTVATLVGLTSTVATVQSTSTSPLFLSLASGRVLSAELITEYIDADSASYATQTSATAATSEGVDSPTPYTARGGGTGGSVEFTLQSRPSAYELAEVWEVRGLAGSASGVTESNTPPLTPPLPSIAEGGGGGGGGERTDETVVRDEGAGDGDGGVSVGGGVAAPPTSISIGPTTAGSAELAPLTAVSTNMAESSYSSTPFLLLLEPQSTSRDDCLPVARERGAGSGGEASSTLVPPTATCVGLLNVLAANSTFPSSVSTAAQVTSLTSLLDRADSPSSADVADHVMSEAGGLPAQVTQAAAPPDHATSAGLSPVQLTSLFTAAPAATSPSSDITRGLQSLKRRPSNLSAGSSSPKGCLISAGGVVTVSAVRPSTPAAAPTSGGDVVGMGESAAPVNVSSSFGVGGSGSASGHTLGVSGSIASSPSTIPNTTELSSSSSSGRGLLQPRHRLTPPRAPPAMLAAVIAARSHSLGGGGGGGGDSDSGGSSSVGSFSSGSSVLGLGRRSEHSSMGFGRSGSLGLEPISQGLGKAGEINVTPVLVARYLTTTPRSLSSRTLPSLPLGAEIGGNGDVGTAPPSSTIISLHQRRSSLPVSPRAVAAIPPANVVSTTASTPAATTLISFVSSAAPDDSAIGGSHTAVAVPSITILASAQSDVALLLNRVTSTSHASPSARTFDPGIGTVVGTPSPWASSDGGGGGPTAVLGNTNFRRRVGGANQLLGRPHSHSEYSLTSSDAATLAIDGAGAGKGGVKWGTRGRAATEALPYASSTSGLGGGCDDIGDNVAEEWALNLPLRRLSHPHAHAQQQQQQQQSYNDLSGEVVTDVEAALQLPSPPSPSTSRGRRGSWGRSQTHADILQTVRSSLGGTAITVGPIPTPTGVDGAAGVLGGTSSVFAARTVPMFGSALSSPTRTTHDGALVAAGHTGAQMRNIYASDNAAAIEAVVSMRPSSRDSRPAAAVPVAKSIFPSSSNFSPQASSPTTVAASPFPTPFLTSAYGDRAEALAPVPAPPAPSSTTASGDGFSSEAARAYRSSASRRRSQSRSRSGTLQRGSSSSTGSGGAGDTPSNSHEEHNNSSGNELSTVDGGSGYVTPSRPARQFSSASNSSTSGPTRSSNGGSGGVVRRASTSSHLRGGGGGGGGEGWEQSD